MNDIMKNDKSKCIDINVNIAGTEAVPKTIMRLVEKLLGPGTDQFGYFIQDIVKCVESIFWKNIFNIIGYTKDMPNMENNNLYTNHRMFFSIINNGGWIDDEHLQKMWAGLLASSRSIDGKDDSNLIYINLLSQLTSSEVKILDYVCVCSEKSVTTGHITSTPLLIGADMLLDITGLADIHRIDGELDHLISLGLLKPLEHPYDENRWFPTIALTILALNLYVRCQGSLQSPIEYFGLF